MIDDPLVTGKCSCIGLNGHWRGAQRQENDRLRKLEVPLRSSVRVGQTKCDAQGRA
ncbi:hypothetical protein [Paraburkholderia sediminicola]|uniref:hypothetical protein n=1 Tax=Paraburkholderia sediminicola TaxID=458836 RepID=UPI0038BAA073